MGARASGSWKSWYVKEGGTSSPPPPPPSNYHLLHTEFCASLDRSTEKAQAAVETTDMDRAEEVGTDSPNDVLGTEVVPLGHQLRPGHPVCCYHLA